LLTPGAGHNFGVVTEFTFHAFEQTNHVWSGVITCAPDKIPMVVEAFTKVMKNILPKAALGAGIGCLPGMTAPTVLISHFYNGTEDEGKKVF
jgi:hypothetical protein